MRSWAPYVLLFIAGGVVGWMLHTPKPVTAKAIADPVAEQRTYTQRYVDSLQVLNDTLEAKNARFDSMLQVIARDPRFTPGAWRGHPTMDKLDFIIGKR